jgi:hypothetical protein
VQTRPPRHPALCRTMTEHNSQSPACEYPPLVHHQSGGVLGSVLLAVRSRSCLELMGLDVSRETRVSDWRLPRDAASVLWPSAGTMCLRTGDKRRTRRYETSPTTTHRRIGPVSTEDLPIFSDRPLAGLRLRIACGDAKSLVSSLISADSHGLDTTHGFASQPRRRSVRFPNPVATA